VARLTGNGNVRPGQCEPGCAVIKRRRLPDGRTVARFALVIQCRRHVIGVRRSRIVGGVAWIAVSIYQLKVAVGVTCLARGCDVYPCQLKLRRVVIECRRLPDGGRMTRLAGVVEIACNVVRVVDSGKIRRMTLITVGVCELIVAVRVTRLTCNGSMRSGQRKFGRTVIECRRLP
jgi:hypothetical protein